MTGLDRESIARAYGTIEPYVRETPVIRVAGEDLDCPAGPLTLKLELFQHSGSFKAFNLRARPVPPPGVVAASGGNHGAAVAFAARRLGVPARIYVPTVASPAKLAQIRAYGAELIVGGERYADALEASEQWAATTGAMPIHAYEQLETLLGQGTIGLELDRQTEIDTLLVAVGGGGLIGGIAAWYAGGIRLVGVEPEAAPTLTRALAAGRPVDAEAGGIAADSLAPRRVGSLMFPLAQRYVERVVLVSDDAIRSAQAALWAALRVASEPGGAAALAALVSGAYRPAAGERVGVLVCGANTTAVDFSR